MVNTLKAHLPPGERAIRFPRIIDLTPRQQQYIALLNSGQNHKECSELLRVTPKTLYNWRQNPTFVYFWNEVSKSVRERLKGLQPKAVARLGQLVDSDDHRVALMTCLVILKSELEKLNSQSIAEDPTTEIERFADRAERIELAKQVRRYLVEHQTNQCEEQENTSEQHP